MNNAFVEMAGRIKRWDKIDRRVRRDLRLRGADLLAEFLRVYGINQRQGAVLMDVSYPYLNRWLQGHDVMSVKAAVRVINLLEEIDG